MLLLGIIDTGTAMTLLNPAVRGFLNGLILLAAILVNKYRIALRDRILMARPERGGGDRVSARRRRSRGPRCSRSAPSRSGTARSHALRGVTLEIARSEIVGLIGDNGAGKSSLIKVISGVASRDGGQVSWKGGRVDLRLRPGGPGAGHRDRAPGPGRGRDHERRAQHLPGPGADARAWGPFRVLDRERMAREADRLLRDLRLHISSVEQEARFCSGGEMQGVAIARAMHFQASLVILDEPTTALAVTGVQTVLSFIRRLKQDGIACILVTHNLHDVHEVADRFLVMVRGAVAANLPAGRGRRSRTWCELQLGGRKAG